MIFPWKFETRPTLPAGGVEIGHSADKMSFNAASGLVAIACNDLGIYMYDIEVTRPRKSSAFAGILDFVMFSSKQILCCAVHVHRR